jgi:DNA-binding transcriptional MerR regulator
MENGGLLIGAVATRSGVSRKAIRLYEAAGILDRPARTRSGYRLYPPEALALLGFVAQARRLGFTLAEIREIVAIKRAGGAPCRHVQMLVRRKAQELDLALRDLTAVRRQLSRLMRAPAPRGAVGAVVCPHIEATKRSKAKRSETTRRTSWNT